MTSGSSQGRLLSTAAGIAPFANWGRRSAAMRRLSNQLVVIPLFILDALCIALSMLVAYQLRFRLLRYYAEVPEGFYTHLALVAVPMWLFVFAFHRLYSQDYLFDGLREYAGVANACTTGLVGLVVYSFLNRYIDHDISRGWLAIVWLISIVSLSTVRFGYRRLVYYLRREGMFVRRALVVGTNEEARAVMAQLRTSPNAGIEVVGFVEPARYREPRMEGLPVLSGLNRLDSIIRSLEVDELIVIPTALQREELLDIYRDWGTDSRVRINLSSGLYELFTTGAQVRDVGFVPLVSLNRTRITGMDGLMKAVLDYVGALIAVILLAPVFAVIAILVRMSSPGSIIYRRRVVGLHGQRFDAYKFRTMIPDADAYLAAHRALQEEWERTGKIENDPRITRIGRTLRRFSLDELPQLFNVLKGQMSLVGPRMIVPSELKHFRRWRHNLLTVKPGLTGLWQVSGRSDLSYEERVRLDMQYIRSYTIWLDLRLLFNTVQVVFKGRGAY